MTYEKPEVSVFGKATEVIQGTKVFYEEGDGAGLDWIELGPAYEPEA